MTARPAYRRVLPVCCTVDGCDLETVARELCQRHYMRWWRYGDPTHVIERPVATHRTRVTPRRYV